LYDNFYDHSEHLRVCQSVAKLDIPWIVSYDAVPQIIEMYAQWKSIKYSLGYSASTVASGSEVMFFSSHLRIPEVASPASIARQQVDNFCLELD
jgi:DNA adenine methylase